MLQLNKSQTTNTVAFYPDTPITGSAVSVRFTGSQDYDRHNTEFDGSVISNLNNTPWVIAQIAGTTLPSASGFYTLNVYELLPAALVEWENATFKWDQYSQTWDNAQRDPTPGDLLTTLRAFNSGSDVTPIAQYVSPNENGAYTTYIG
jgi:hypothetical protein